MNFKNDDSGARTCVKLPVVRDEDFFGAELVAHDVSSSASILGDAARSTMAQSSSVF